MYSEDVLLENIYVSSRSNSSYDAHNTDGADTIYANRITFRGWDIDNGDDSIGEDTRSPEDFVFGLNTDPTAALKANSTNILMENMILRGGLGIAMGSIGTSCMPD